MKKKNEPGTCHHLIINAALVGPGISITKCLSVHFQQGLCVREYLKNTRKGNQLFNSFFILHIYRSNSFTGEIVFIRSPYIEKVLR